MKKRAISVLLSIVLTVGNAGAVPAFAAETSTAKEAVPVEEQTVEEATDVSEETDSVEVSETTVEETVVAEEGTLEEAEEVPVETEEAVTDESTEDSSEEKSAEEIEEEASQDSTELIEEAEIIEESEVVEEAESEEAAETSTFEKQDGEISVESAAENEVESKDSLSAQAIETGSFNGHKYAIYNIGGSYDDAKAFCEAQGGYLASISSKEENDFLYNFIISQGIKNAYFGYTDQKTEGEWLWINGEESGYTNWAINEPNSERDNEDYAEFYYKYTSGEWNDGSFGNGTSGDEKNFICEWGWEIKLFPEPGTEDVDYTHPIRIVFDKSIIANNGYAYLYEEGKQDPVDRILLDDDYVTMYSYGQSKDNLQLVFPNVVEGNNCIESGKDYYIEITEDAIKLSDEQGSYSFPGIKEQNWSFSTIDQEYASFSNPNLKQRNDEISKELFRYVFKAPIITQNMYNHKKYRQPKGICFGMAYVSGAKMNNLELARQFRKLYSYDFSNTDMINSGFTLSEYIKMAQIYQLRDDQTQELEDTTNDYSYIVNAIKSNEPIVLHIWNKGVFGVKIGSHALMPIKTLDSLSSDSEIKVLVYDCNGVLKEYDDSRFNNKSFLSVLTFKKEGESIVGFEYKDDSKNSNKYDCIAVNVLDDKFEKLITSEASIFNYEEYYQGHPLLRVLQDATIATNLVCSNVIRLVSSFGEETEETEEDFYWVKGPSFNNTLAGDSTFSITDGYDEIEVTASKGASINIDIKDNTAKVVNTDASAPNYTITHTRAEDDNSKKSVVINGETSSTVNTEKTDDGIIVKNEDGTPVQVEIVFTNNNTVVQNVETSATTDSINIKYDEENTLTVTEDVDSDGTYETVIVKQEIAKEISGADISGITNKTYTGKALTQSVIVKYGDATLVQDTDYTVSYKNNINAGTASVTITGKGNYTGSVTKTFTINKAAQSITAKSSAATVSVGKTATVSTTGAKGAVTYSSSNTAVATVDSKTGKVTAKKVGTVTITAQSAATANYGAASKAVTVKVVPTATASLSAANLSTGIKLKWKKVAGANGYIIYRNGTKIKTITNGTTVTFSDTKANTNGKKYTYKVVAKGATGTSTLSRSRIMYRVARTAVSSLASRSAGKITVKWKRNSKANGYVVQYSKSKSFSSGNKTSTITKNKLINKTFRSLTKGKKYYVRVRCFKTVSGKKYYSSWSAVKAVTVKK